MRSGPVNVTHRQSLPEFILLNNWTHFVVQISFTTIQFVFYAAPQGCSYGRMICEPSKRMCAVKTYRQTTIFFNLSASMQSFTFRKVINTFCILYLHYDYCCNVTYLSLMTSAYVVSYLTNRWPIALRNPFGFSTFAVGSSNVILYFFFLISTSFFEVKRVRTCRTWLIDTHCRTSSSHLHTTSLIVFSQILVPFRILT